MSFERKPGGFLFTWKTAEENKVWGAWKGGYLAVSKRGIKFLQRFAEWGVASVGQQKELVVRFELTCRQVETAGLMHLEMGNLNEARLCLLNVSVWKGWNLFFILNLGIRLTAASQTIRASRMREIMLEKAKREQAERIRSQRFAAQMRRRVAGHPWPPHMKSK